MTRKADETTLKTRKLISLFGNAKGNSAEGKLGFILRRLRQGFTCMKQRTDPAGAECSETLVGEYLLKTWRMTEEQDVIESVENELSDHISDFHSLAEYIQINAKSLLGDKHFKLTKVEKKIPFICAYLLTAAEAFQEASLEEEGEIKEELEVITDLFRELAYTIYNGCDYTGSFVPFLKIIPKVDNLTGHIRDVDWSEKLPNSSAGRIADLTDLCSMFNVVMSPYIPWMADSGSGSDRKIPIDIDTPDRLHALRLQVSQFKIPREKVYNRKTPLFKVSVSGVGTQTSSAGNGNNPSSRSVSYRAANPLEQKPPLTIEISDDEFEEEIESPVKKILAAALILALLATVIFFAVKTDWFQSLISSFNSKSTIKRSVSIEWDSFLSWDSFKSPFQKALTTKAHGVDGFYFEDNL